MGQKTTDRKTIFLDVGANLGIHALYVAKLGFQTWAVEPQTINVIKVRIKIFYYCHDYLLSLKCNFVYIDRYHLNE